MPFTSLADLTSFDAGMFIGALLEGDPRHAEARPLVEAARRGEMQVCTTPGILSEVYGALTWEKAQPRHPPIQAASAVRLLVVLPSAIEVIEENLAVILRALELAANHNLTARRVHDARHAAAALTAGIHEIYTYDIDDWRRFEADGLQVVGPESVLSRIKKASGR